MLEEDEEIEEDRKEEREMQKSPDPPAIPLVGPIDLPALQSLSLSSSFICEMPNCGAVRVFGVFNGGGVVTSELRFWKSGVWKSGPG